MKYLFRTSAIIVLFMLIHYQSDGQTNHVTSKRIIEQQIDSLFTASVKLSESLDYTQLAKSVDDSQMAGFITNNVYYSRFDSLIGQLKDKASGVIGQHVSVLKKKVTVISEDISLVTASGTSDIELTNGGQFQIRFFWTFVYQKINNQWKVIQSHQSSTR